MKIDVTLPVTPDMLAAAPGNTDKRLVGHVGTHFDVMEQTFPLEYTERRAVVLDVSGVKGRDIGVEDIALDKIHPDMFVTFYTGFIETEGYGTRRYYKEHPQLSPALIEVLLDKRISIIGVDCAGIRRGSEHTPIDRHCAEHGVFVVENLCNLKAVLEATGPIVMHTYPINYTGITGLPCRVIAQV